MRKRRATTIGVLAMTVLATVRSEAATFYVAATDGNDDHAGTLAAPFKTIGRGLSRAAPGDTIIVRAGTYPESVTVATERVTLKNYPGERPIVDGSSISGGPYAPLVSLTANGTAVDGFMVRDSVGCGIVVRKADNCAVRRCVVDGTSRHGIGVLIDTHHTLVEDCEVRRHNTCNMPEVRGKPSWGSGITTGAGRNADVTIRRCNVHEGWGEGICVSRLTDTARVEYCEIYDNFSAQLYADTARNATFRYNLIYGTRNPRFYRGRTGNVGGGIALANEVKKKGYGHGHRVYGNLVAGTVRQCISVGGDGIEDALIYNNTCVGGVVACVQSARLQPGGAWIRNNIFVHGSGKIANVGHGCASFESNLWSRPRSEVDPMAHGPADIYGVDPRLLNVPGWDTLSPGAVAGAWFALRPDSPARDRGLRLSAPNYCAEALEAGSVWTGSVRTLDQSRYGAGWEIGAFVYTPLGAASAPRQPEDGAHPGAPAAETGP
ncbi:MAG: right-handed parallel beta-helix repeat-containing protein [Kiritimatiellae bacterium]|nr:right-handed parallel beta-helix repeat-containing protein [Kiritimatiellia bacterium]